MIRAIVETDATSWGATPAWAPSDGEPEAESLRHPPRVVRLADELLRPRLLFVLPDQSGTAVPRAAIADAIAASFADALHDATAAHTLSFLAYDSVLEPGVATSADSVPDDLARIRELTTLSVADIARLCGVKRRQLYNLLDGQPTDPRRARHIRALRAAIERWARRLPDPITLRSVLFAPLDEDRRDFVALAAADEPAGLTRATAAVDAYLARLGDGRPVHRASSSAPGAAAAAARDLRRLYGEDERGGEA
jgi:hypothetical protein